MKRLLKAILWIVCYGGASWFTIKLKLGFNILNLSNWEVLFDKSVHAVWPEDMAPKKLVCKVLFGFIVIGILGLSIVTKKRKSRIPVVKGDLPQQNQFRPSPMASQGKLVSPAASITFSAPTVQTSNNPVPTSQNSMSDAIHQITEIADTFEVSVFPHVKLENTFTQLVISDDGTALLLKILPQQGMWQVNPDTQIENSQWVIENEPPKNILKDIIESTATLSRLEPEAHAISVVILIDGTVNEPINTRQYLEQNGIRLVSLNKNMPDIPTLSDLLSEFYQPKQSEDINETNNGS